MEILQNLYTGFEIALSLKNLFFCFMGVTLGTLIGVLPGIGPVTGVAILIPITSTTSILINVPGESSSVMTTLDGYQMALKGRAGPALGMAAISSFIAGTFSIIMLSWIAPVLADFAVAFGPPEYFALTFMGLTMVTSLAGDSLIKGIMSGVFGLLLACVGVDAISGSPRFIFGSIYLLDGIGFIGVAVGLFALAEVLINIEEPLKQVFVKTKLNIRNLFPNRQDWKDSAGALWRGSILGFFVGVLPGAGATVASFLSYATEKKLSKHPEKFGTGVIEGVAGPEGAGTTAVLMGALLIHGIRPGPLLFYEHPEVVWGLIASMYIGNVLLLPSWESSSAFCESLFGSFFR